MGRIECVCCEKLQHDFVSGTYALIAPVHPILHRVSCSYETIPNAPKDYETLKKQECWIRRGGSSAFVATNSDTTSGHDFLH